MIVSDKDYEGAAFPNPTEEAFYEAEESRSDPREFEHVGQVEVQLEGMDEPVRVDELTLDDLNSTNYPKDGGGERTMITDVEDFEFVNGLEDTKHRGAVPDSIEHSFTMEFDAKEEPVEETDTLMMAKAVDVSDVDGTQQQMYREMARLFEEQFELFINKNRDYDSSFETGGEVEQLLGDGPFDDAETANLYKLFTRIGDKRQRFFTQAFCNGDDNVNESLHETAKDAMNYYAMLAYLTNDE